MAVPVIMPRQGQSVETCIITRWLINKGEEVKKGDILYSYETDKASFDAEAEEEGILLEIFYGEGDEVPVLTNVAVIGKKGEDVDSFRPDGSQDDEEEPAHPAEEKEEIKAEESLPAEEKPAGTDQKIRISPRAKVIAEKLGIDPGTITGSGPNGRIIARDLDGMAKSGDSPGKTIVIGAQTAEKGTGIAYDYSSVPGSAYTDKVLPNIRKIIAKTMYASISNSAQLTHHMSADVRRLLDLRKKVKADMEKGSTHNITLNDMVCFACIRALEKFPELNSHFLGESTRTFKKVNLGLAVDTDRGLMVPAVQDASDYSLQGLSGKLSETAQQCRSGNVNPELLASTAASFTVSNLGNYGVEMFTPIINLPQVAILGVNTITYRPADIGNGVIGFVPMIGLSLTYDHRAVDGGPATLFLKEIKDQIENFNINI